MKLIVGLGNIGPRYAQTRHNIGFMVVDELAREHGAPWKLESKLMSDVAITSLEQERIILAKPQTMMNLSGEAVQRLVQFYKLTPADIWAVFDELDVPFGRLRLRRGGSGGGHQGANSLIQHIGAGFMRVRVGISLNDRTQEPSEVYVLKPFNNDEREQLPTVISNSATLLAAQLLLPNPEESTFNLT